MANEIQADFDSGATLYALVRNAVGEVWSVTGSAFETYVTANLANYKIAMTEQGTASGFYAASMPSVSIGTYNVIAKRQAGGAPAETDRSVANGAIEWDGSAVGVVLSANGLDSIPTTAPTGVASSFREMIVQTWRRFFKKSTLTSSQLKTYADNGTTVLTTQTVSDDATTQTQGAAT